MASTALLSTRAKVSYCAKDSQFRSRRKLLTDRHFRRRELRCPNGVIWPPFSPCRCFVRIASTVAGSARWSTPWTMPSQKDRKCKVYEWPVHSRSELKRNISWSRPGRSRSCATCRRPSSRLPRLRPTAVSRPSSCSRRSR